MPSLGSTMITSGSLRLMQTSAWCLQTPLHTSNHTQQGAPIIVAQGAWSSGQSFTSPLEFPNLTSDPPHLYSYRLHWYRSCLFTYRSWELPCSGHASILWQAPGHSHSSIFQHIPRYYRASNSLHARATGMPSIPSFSSAIATAFHQYLPIRIHSCTLLLSWLMPRASNTEQSSVAYMGCEHYISTWACQTC